MLSYPPNAFKPIMAPNPPVPKFSSNFMYLYRSNFCPRTSTGAGLTQSVSVHPISNGDRSRQEHDSEGPRFSETVQVLPTLSGGYRVLRPGISAASQQWQEQQQSTAIRNPNAVDQCFFHNISSPDMQLRLRDRLSLLHKHEAVRRPLFESSSTPNASIFFHNHQRTADTSDGAGLSRNITPENKSFHESLQPSGKTKEKDFQCSCKMYHSHTFRGRPINQAIVRETHKFIETMTSAEVREYSNDDLRNIFWTPSLSFHPYQNGDRKVRALKLTCNSVSTVSVKPFSF